MILKKEKNSFFLDPFLGRVLVFLLSCFLLKIPTSELFSSCLILSLTPLLALTHLSDKVRY